jgi:hypothetical protein
MLTMALTPALSATPTCGEARPRLPGLGDFIVSCSIRNINRDINRASRDRKATAVGRAGRELALPVAPSPRGALAAGVMTAPRFNSRERPDTIWTRC